MDIKEEDILGETVSKHWYYRSKAKALIYFLEGFKPQNILDIGAGSGFFSKQLLNQSNTTQATCVDISYTSDSKQTFNNKPIFYQRQCDSGNADLVLMMDVLEHVDDDLALLSEYISKVPNQTKFMITVPAFSFLWSEHDLFLKHKRRYTLKQVEQLLKNAGLEIKRSAYYFSLVFPIALLSRLPGILVQKITHQANAGQAKSLLKQHSFLTNAFLSMLCQLELPLMKRNRIAGLSVFCLAQKTQTTR